MARGGLVSSSPPRREHHGSLEAVGSWRSARGGGGSAGRGGSRSATDQGGWYADWKAEGAAAPDQAMVPFISKGLTGQDASWASMVEAKDQEQSDSGMPNSALAVYDTFMDPAESPAAWRVGGFPGSVHEAGIWVVGPFGNFYQKVEYEGVASICFHCGCMGHKIDKCKLRPPMVVLPKPHDVKRAEVTKPTLNATKAPIQNVADGYGPWIIARRRKRPKEKKGVVDPGMVTTPHSPSPSTHPCFGIVDPPGGIFAAAKTPQNLEHLEDVPMAEGKPKSKKKQADGKSKAGLTEEFFLQLPTKSAGRKRRKSAADYLLNDGWDASPLVD
ncbi:hypothetical protein KSP40_PGU004031 [Platanthera guangdongensis]|uniref:CCHC-type domain-containing protein n=1 Tax=Platanthera guangdongensis TaxID=2320717 RepID=A0ABR2LZT9_9ASPA